MKSFFWGMLFWCIQIPVHAQDEAIERAQETGADSLNLYCSGTIPERIQTLTHLKKLVLRGNIRDISALRDLTQLTHLDLKNNCIRDISVLQHLKQLTWLDLGDNKITDYAALKDLKALTWLNLSAHLSTFYEYQLKRPLTWYDVFGYPIKDLSFLSQLKQLRYLDLSFRKIADISELRSLSELTTLDLVRNRIKDLSALRDLRQLTILKLSNNRIRDIAALQDLKQLWMLNLGRNQIKDLAPLQNLEQLSDLDLHHNRIQQLSALQNLKQLRILYLSNNQIQHFDVSFFNACPNLQSVDLVRNPIPTFSTSRTWFLFPHAAPADTMIATGLRKEIVLITSSKFGNSYFRKNYMLNGQGWARNVTYRSIEDIDFKKFEEDVIIEIQGVDATDPQWDSFHFARNVSQRLYENGKTDAVVIGAYESAGLGKKNDFVPNRKFLVYNGVKIHETTEQEPLSDERIRTIIAAYQVKEPQK